MNIGIDFDNVIANSAALKIKRFKELGYRVGPKTSSKQTFSKSYPKKEYEKIVSKLYASDEMLKVRAIPNAKTAIEKLKSKHKIFIITSRTQKETIYAKAWLKSRNIEYDGFYHVSNTSKKDIIKKLNIQIYIDDDKDKLKDIQKTKLLLFSRPYNKDTKLPKEITRVSSWPQCLRHIK